MYYRQNQGRIRRYKGGSLAFAESRYAASHGTWRRLATSMGSIIMSPFQSGLVAKPYTTGFVTCRVFRIDLETNSAVAFATTAPRRVLGQVVDADGNLYCAQPDTPGSQVVKITPDAQQSVYSRGPAGIGFMSANTPVFDRAGNMYVSDTGSWSERSTATFAVFAPVVGTPRSGLKHPIDTPNGIAIDPEEKFIYYFETWGNSISRIAINKDGSSGDAETRPAHAAPRSRWWLLRRRWSPLDRLSPARQVLRVRCDDAPSGSFRRGLAG